ncbi:Uncharacterised protein [Mycobacterium tuberculosis]|uniref:Uncharacterized protein n=1 Tax=Mycobacterium tuberculosis TaxID=1773 RepID=A0A916P6H3_MYCTX|nr:Uncharacterised protein [Mycobacterium tuberculosis]
MMSCSASGAPTPRRSKNSGTRVFLPDASTTNSAGTTCKPSPPSASPLSTATPTMALLARSKARSATSDS